MLNDKFRTALADHVGWVMSVVHRIGEVAHQHHVLVDPHLLADSERSAEDALARIDAHELNIGDPALRKIVEDLPAVVADSAVVRDAEARMLAASSEIERCPKSFDASLRASSHVMARTTGVTEESALHLDLLSVAANGGRASASFTCEPLNPMPCSPEVAV